MNSKIYDIYPAVFLIFINYGFRPVENQFENHISLTIFDPAKMPVRYWVLIRASELLIIKLWTFPAKISKPFLKGRKL